MTHLTRARAAAATDRPLTPRQLGAGIGVLMVATVATAAAPDGAGARWFLAAAFSAALAFLCVRSPAQGIVATFVWLIALGASRRVASELLADPGRDPLVLVGAVAAATLTVRAWLAGAARHLTVLAWALLAFNALAVVQLVNPDQSSGLGRAAGLLVWVVPTMWFWVGRRLVDDRLALRLLLVVGGATTITALYGIVQSVIAFPPWDERWIDRRGYAALLIGPETVRPFGSYASAAEFALACAVGAVIAATAVIAPGLLATARRRRRTRSWIRLTALAVFGITVLGLLLSAVRSYLALLAVALPLVYLAYRGRRAWKVLALAFVVAVVLIAALAQIDPDSIGRDGPQAAFRRILVMVNDPFTSNAENTDNTLELHYENAKRGFEDAWSHPLGRGTSATGIAGGAFGGESTSTDVDLSDAGIAFGLLGPVLAIAVVVLGCVTAARAAVRQRTFERVAVVGILVVSFGAWFQGAHYAMAPLLWLMLGRADAALARPDRASGSARSPDRESRSE